MTDIDAAALKLVGALEPYTHDERDQLLLQAEALCSLYDAGKKDAADALLELFKDGQLQVRKDQRGFSYTLTDIGLASAAALVREMNFGKPN